MFLPVLRLLLCGIAVSAFGSAASAQVFATLGTLHHGCELFGPQLLVEDIVRRPMPIADFALQLPDGHGIGVEPGGHIPAR